MNKIVFHLCGLQLISHNFDEEALVWFGSMESNGIGWSLAELSKKESGLSIIKTFMTFYCKF